MATVKVWMTARVDKRTSLLRRKLRLTLGFQTFPVAIDKAPELSQTMTKDQTIAAALQVTDVLVILAKGAKKLYPWKKCM